MLLAGEKGLLYELAGVPQVQFDDVVGVGDFGQDGCIGPGVDGFEDKAVVVSAFQYRYKGGFGLACPGMTKANFVVEQIAEPAFQQSTVSKQKSITNVSVETHSHKGQLADFVQRYKAVVDFDVVVNGFFRRADPGHIETATVLKNNRAEHIGSSGGAQAHQQQCEQRRVFQCSVFQGRIPE